MLDLDAIKARLAEWQRLKQKMRTEEENLGSSIGGAQDHVGFFIVWRDMTTGEAGMGDCLEISEEQGLKMVVCLNDRPLRNIIHLLIPCADREQWKAKYQDKNHHGD